MIELIDMPRVIDELNKSAFAVTDKTVAKLYPELISHCYIVPSGEQAKSPEVLFDILREMNARGLKKGDGVIAIGGGAVSDVTGLAASLYMRGLPTTVVPTTFLAMVDAAYGGKTAIDFCGIKNLVGSFHFPQKVLVCTDFLSTLNPEQMLCGMGEAIKTCLLSVSGFSLLVGLKPLLPCDGKAAKKLIYKCAQTKLGIVARDPYDSSLRHILNVGHTVGHAAEVLSRRSHGQCVISGMITECAMFNDFIAPDYYAKLMDILCSLGSVCSESTDSVVNLCKRDKKNGDNSITVEIPTDYGEITELKVTQDEFIERYGRVQ